MMGHRGHVILFVAMFINSANSYVIGTLSNQQLTAKVANLTEEFQTLGNKVDNILQLLTSSVTECPPSWIKFQSSCYGVGDALVTWGAAQEICSEFGGRLVEVNSLAENEFIKGIGYARGYGRMWLGATDAFSDGHWRWTNSGRLVSEGFSDWEPGQETANDGGNQDCLSMFKTYRREYRWVDYECNKPVKFICEVSLAN